MKTQRELLDAANSLVAQNMNTDRRDDSLFENQEYYNWLEYVRVFIHNKTNDRKQYEDFIYLKEHADIDNHKKIIAIINSLDE